MNNRNRNLLNLAHRVPICQNCERHVGGCEPAHQNGIGAGKGFGIKAHDNRHAALCHECHAWLDQGGAMNDPSGRWSPSRLDKQDMWLAAHLRTFDYYWSQGWLRVA